jgi:1-acyl-sn-glycerol-3-phosphate acyltransferase
MDLSVLQALDAASLRTVMPSFLGNYVVGDEERSTERIRTFLNARSDPALDAILELLRTIGANNRLYTANSDCRELAREWCRDVFTTTDVQGIEHLRAATKVGPTLLLCNHLSYLDAIATDAAVAWAQHPDLADRIVFAAGPKVYSDLFRRVAAACLNTLPVPQSSRFGNTAQLSPRELAGQARACMEEAHEALDEGYIVLLYPEGSRTRSGRLGPFLKALRRYIKHGDSRVVPMVIQGTDQIMPVGDDRVRPGELTIEFLPALRVQDFERAQDVLVAAREAIAPKLPESQQPQDSDTPLF